MNKPRLSLSNAGRFINVTLSCKTITFGSSLLPIVMTHHFLSFLQLTTIVFHYLYISHLAYVSIRTEYRKSFFKC
ncbi:hypothetical protein DFJ43DRAFT_517657 [Lentinula guzmanii]|uniref:Uncharacterized protein n=1 Tax=Lentinula guzmanii TaxID=2804957 RepID=A0AA38JUZ4_9AGAR|nr:hypothetical protein DFJ43DRAFT_517657 [Lentinula guzmanii]